MHSRWPLPIVVLLGSALAAAQTPASQPTTRAAELPPAVARVLQLAPDDTHLVVVIPAIDALVKGVADFGKAVELPTPEEFSAAELLSELLDDCGKAIDTTGPLVIALSAEREEPLLIATVKDAAAWSATTAPTAVRGADVYELKHERLAAVTREKVVVFGRERGDVEAALGATGKFVRKLSPEHLALAARRQVFVFVEVPPWEMTIQQGLSFMMQMISMGAASAGPEGEAAMQFWRVACELLGKLVQETDTYAAGLQIDTRGVFFEDRATFKADGGVARYLAGVRPGSGDLFRGLPSAAVLAFGSEWESAPDAPSLNELMLKSMVSLDALRARLGPDKLEAAVKHTAAMYRAMSGMNGALVPAEGGGMLYAGLYFTKDAEALLRETRTVMQDSPELMKAWSALPNAEIQHESEMLDGTPADCFLFKFSSDNPQIQPMFDAFYGRDASLYCLAAPHGAVYTMGPRALARTLAVRMKTASATTLAREPRYEALARSLSPRPQFCLAIDLPATVQLFMKSLEKAGLPLPPVELGQPAGPLAGLGFYLERLTVRTELLVPAESIRALAKGFGAVGAGPREAY